MTTERHSPEWLIENADHGIAFEVACASALTRLLAANAELQQQLEAIGAGGVGPLMKSAGSNHVEQRLKMVPAGWKLVPVEPTIPMLHRADGLTCIDFAALGEEGAFDLDELKEIYRAMLAAAPQPPVVEQPQGEQEPVAWQYRMRPDWGSKKDCWGPWQDCTKEQAAMYQRVPLLHDWAYESRQLYTHPQPQREPLTEADLYDIAGNYFADEWAQKQAVMMLKDHGIGGEK